MKGFWSFWAGVRFSRLDEDMGKQRLLFRDWWLKLKTGIEKNEGLILILLLVAVLRIPGLFEPNRYADEDIYLTLGQGLRKGLVFYRDIHDNKPPLLYLVAAMAGSVMWFRLILMAWNLVNVVLVWKLAEKLIKSRWLMVLVTGVFGVFTSIPLTEGNIANGEVFMIMPVTAGVLLMWVESNKRVIVWKKWIMAGVLFSLGFLFKVPVLFDLFGVLFWLSVYQVSDWRGWFKWIVDRRLWLVLTGFLVPVLLSIVYYVAEGAGERYLRSALGQNIGYLSSWEGGSGAFYENGLFQRGVVLLVWLIAIWCLRKRLGREFGLASLWLVGGLFGANLAGRPYPHYLIEIVAPASLLIGLVIDRFKLIKAGVAFVLALTVGVAIWRYEYWYYKSVDYYVNFVMYVTGQKTREDFYDFFGNGVVRNMRVAEYIRQRTDQDAKIFVWGTEPAIYVLSDRLPVGRYTVNYHIRDFDGMSETMAALTKEGPKYIVTIEGELVDRELDAYLSAYYLQVMEDGGAVVWRRWEASD